MSYSLHINTRQFRIMACCTIPKPTKFNIQHFFGEKRFLLMKTPPRVRSPLPSCSRPQRPLMAVRERRSPNYLSIYARGSDTPLRCKSPPGPRREALRGVVDGGRRARGAHSGREKFQAVWEIMKSPCALSPPGRRRRLEPGLPRCFARART